MFPASQSLQPHCIASHCIALHCTDQTTKDRQDRVFYFLQYRPGGQAKRSTKVNHTLLSSGLFSFSFSFLLPLPALFLSRQRKVLPINRMGSVQEAEIQDWITGIQSCGKEWNGMEWRGPSRGCWQKKLVVVRVSSSTSIVVLEKAWVGRKNRPQVY